MRFRVYPARNGRLYFEVRIYDSPGAMRRALKRNDCWLGVTGGWGRAEAVCRGFTTLRRIKRRWRKTARLGVIFFHRQNLGVGIVTHEMAHAAVHWATRIGLSGRAVWGRSIRPQGDKSARLMPRANERFAWAMGSLCAQFWAHYYSKRPRDRLTIYANALANGGN